MKRFLYVLNFLLLLSLLFSCLSCYIPPATAWLLSFFGLAFSYIFFLLLFFLLFWYLRKDRMAWVNLFFLLFSLPFARTVFGLHFWPGGNEGLKVMSYNVRNFDLYNWSGNTRTRAAMMELIKRENPDVICFQEFYTEDENFHNLEYLRDTLGYRFNYFHVTYDQWFKNTSLMKWCAQKWGLAIFSRYEITDTGRVNFEGQGGNQCIYAGLLVDGKKLRVYNTHLQSIHLNYDDYDAIEELNDNYSSNWNRVESILKKMKQAFIRRGRQAETVHRHLQQYTGAKILCGDFNDSPVSYSYQTISKGMQDAFTRCGWGIERTYASHVGAFRIDFILASPSLSIQSYHSLHENLSDHYPVVVRVKV